MATSEILASGTTGAGSTEFTVTSGGTATVLLKDAAGYAVNPYIQAAIQMENAAGTEYFTIGYVSGGAPDFGAKSVASPGTFRVYRDEGGVAFGVDLAV